MNFEIKSTFKNIITSLSHRRNRSRYPGGILCINLASLLLVTGLYLENIIIPATYGSGPSAALWILAFKVLAMGWMSSTLLAMLYLLYTWVQRKPLFIFLNDSVTALLTAAKETVRVQLIQFLLIIHLLKDLERYSQRYLTRKHLLPVGSIQLSSNIFKSN